jgi:hypothetical protein
VTVVDGLNLGQINWRLVAVSSLWILGLSVMLSALGVANYRSFRFGLRLRAVLEAPYARAALNCGLALFCLGLAGSARAGWEGVLWLGLAAAGTVQARRAWLERPGGQAPRRSSARPAARAPSEHRSTGRHG